ncbi:MAG: DNA repair protein RecN [Pseudomonadota bacterium]
MLTQITVKNLAIVDSLDLEFDEGFSVLTGETGAGKSILIDALSLVMGDRSDSSLVRKGAQRADITACFDLENDKQVKHWLEENDLQDDNQNTECIIRRSINHNGRSKGYINGQTVPLQLLRELGEQLINIHGQNSHQLLLNHKTQRLLLDEHAQLSQLTHKLNLLYVQWKKKTSEFEDLNKQQQNQLQQIELLSYQLEELEQFSPIDQEIKALDEEFKKLNHISEINDKLMVISAQLSSSDSFDNKGQSAQQLLSTSYKVLEEIVNYDNSLLDINELLNQALIQVEEATLEIRQYLSTSDVNPERLAELTERISLYYDLSRKHQCEPEVLHERLHEIKENLLQLENSDSYLDELQEQIKTLNTEYFSLAKQLSNGRKLAAIQLAELVEKHIHDLGMDQAKFSIQIKTVDDPSKPVKDGLEQIHYMVSTNPGQSSGLISKIASGGELSRISLAIQVVTAQYSSIPTLIFDEVDVGVGGKIAEMIGAKLHLLAQQVQILCVTHQAQVAAHGDQHYRVEKNTQNQQTVSNIEPLIIEQRIDELSRMLGSANITDTTRLHAKEMLEQSQNA